ncbi:hypothetical protein [Flavilitoribacter nigricans]|uniref:UPF0323 domain-containing protein n=1 Tax=Flavilitoribacter nigricans (strain ATCC 23147 / DSM 23189 / NBRC 102662 / NCIMB 1420 / SS-2) TaxID=1122177 RepID=A0A2D0N3D8_FLAN2|nr:hypothetical protein [Flavilitoribacter nigricans]PHN02273.1 hypothetical protein CRP01_32765 [Flavilitoribacter nigricans DSM 23189 = NBRC 102662]
MKTSKFRQSFPHQYREAVWIALVTLTLSLLVLNCSDTITEEQVEFTQGVITFMEEVEPEQYKIVDEQVVADKTDSKIITDYLDGRRDTISLYEAQAMSADTTSTGTHRRSHYRTYYGGLMGFYLGRSTSIPPSPGVYQNQSTYNRVHNNAYSSMQSTARRTTVTRPSGSSKGFGSSSKSSRSYGG